MGTSEYKEIAHQLGQHNVLDAENAALLRVLAGYRNRMVHFYHEISAEELYEICVTHLADLTRISEAYQTWLAQHPEMLDETL